MAMSCVAFEPAYPPRGALQDEAAAEACALNGTNPFDSTIMLWATREQSAPSCLGSHLVISPPQRQPAAAAAREGHLIVRADPILRARESERACAYAQRGERTTGARRVRVGCTNAGHARGYKGGCEGGYEGGYEGGLARTKNAFLPFFASSTLFFDPSPVAAPSSSAPPFGKSKVNPSTAI